MNNLTKKDAYQTITDQIIAGMEKLEGNWKASWAKRGLPINAEGESYNGLNIIEASSQISGSQVKKDKSVYTLAVSGW